MVDFIDLNISDFNEFKRHEWLLKVKQRYDRDTRVSHESVARAISLLKDLNEQHYDRYQTVLFTTITGRVKSYERFIEKLYGKCKKEQDGRITLDKIMDSLYPDIKDLGGARFSVPYVDEIKSVIEDHVRPEMKNLSWNPYLVSKPGLEDKDYLEVPDSSGYRGYHFYVDVPVTIDIYHEQVEHKLCEIQARTEMQHVWSVKSHELFFSSEVEFIKEDDTVKGLLRAASDAISSADQTLVEVRKRVKELQSDK